MISLTKDRIEQTHGHQQQQGIVLIVGLVMLISITLIGVTAMKSTTLDERIAANTQFKAIAFQTAESVLSDAADWDQAAACHLAGKAICKDSDVVLSGSSETNETTKKYAAGTEEVSGRGEITYLGERPLAGYSIGGPILTPFVQITGCASDAANTCEHGKLGNTNAKATHNLGVALVGVRP